MSNDTDHMTAIFKFAEALLATALFWTAIAALSCIEMYRRLRDKDDRL